MKNTLIRKLRVVKRECRKMQAYVVLMEAVIVFLAFAILLRFMNQNVYTAIIPSAVYMIYMILFAGIKSEGGLVEKIALSNPSVRERIKTSYDNRGYMGRNVILTSLNYDLSKRMGEIGLSSLLDTEKIVTKTFAIVALAFIFLTINFIGFDLHNLQLNLDSRDLDQIMDGISDPVGFKIGEGIGGLGEYLADDRYEDKEEREDIGSSAGGEVPGFSEGEIPDSGGGAGSSGDEDIFGDPSSAKIEGENIDMKLPPEYGGGIEIKDVNEGSVGYPWEGDLAGAGSGMEAGAGVEYTNVEYREIVKKYFQVIHQEV